MMKLEVSEIGFGLITAQNNRVCLMGGSRCGRSNPGENRLMYQIIWKELYVNAKRSGVCEDDAFALSNVGEVQLMVKEGTLFEVASLISIEIKEIHRRKGYAKKLIHDLVDTIDKPLKVDDIQDEAISFWEATGMYRFTSNSGNTINPNTYDGKIGGFVPLISEVV